MTTETTAATKTPSARTIPDDREQRFVRGSVAAVRRAAEGETPAGAIIAGAGIVFNKETVIGGRHWGFREIIAPGAFAKSITEEDQRSFFNHDPNLILGRRSAGTLRVVEDSTGVHYEVDAPDTSYSKDLQVSLERKDVTGSSFIFRTIKEEWTEPVDESDELPLRRVLEAELYELGPVTFPAYEDSTASVGARSKSEALHEKRTAQRAAAAQPTPEEIAAAQAVQHELSARERAIHVQLRMVDVR